MSVVLITGASQGIGKTTALLFARQGYDCVLAARDAVALAQAAEAVQAVGRSALAVPTDVRDPQQVQALVQKGLDHYGAIDVLINNAGIYASGPVEAFSLEDWRHILDTNLWGYIYTINAIVPHFLARRTGTIINVSSIGGKVPIPYVVPYCTSKFAVTGLTEALQAELKPKGIHVGGVYPNLIKSNLMERAVFVGNDAEDAQFRRTQLTDILKVPGVETPEDVAKAIWSAVQQQRAEVLVGSANLSKTVHRLFPGLVEWLFGKTFEGKSH